jgi:hypothetical protein
MIYGSPGTGKTSLGFTADKALLLDFDGGAHRSGNRGDCVRIQSWSEMQAMTAEDLSGYKTIVVDTVGRALDFLSAQIIADEPKHGQRDGSLSLKGFGALKARFTAWVKYMRMMGVDVVLIAHSTEKQHGDDVEERIDAQGGSKDEVYKCADIMGRLAIRGGKRVLLFSPTETAYGKNPAGFPALDVPDFAVQPDYLATIIADTKKHLNAMSAESMEVQGLMDEWMGMFVALTVDEYNAMKDKIKGADPRIADNLKRLLVKCANEAGVVFDAKSKKFVKKEA